MSEHRRFHLCEIFKIEKLCVEDQRMMPDVDWRGSWRMNDFN